MPVKARRYLCFPIFYYDTACISDAGVSRLNLGDNRESCTNASATIFTTKCFSGPLRHSHSNAYGNAAELLATQ